LTATFTLQFEASSAGLREARSEVTRLEELISGVKPLPAGSSIASVRSRCTRGGRSRELLDILPGEEPGLTPEEIADELAPDSSGNRLSKHSVRAILRNIARAEASLLEEGAIDDRVIQKNFDDYRREGAGRYSLKPEDRATLDRLLGK
jgi:hypothetical protein